MCAMTVGLNNSGREGYAKAYSMYNLDIYGRERDGEGEPTKKAVNLANN